MSPEEMALKITALENKIASLDQAMRGLLELNAAYEARFKLIEDTIVRHEDGVTRSIDYMNHMGI